jgi:hypothetical protein
MLDAKLRKKSETSFTNLRLVRSCVVTDLTENTQLFFRVKFFVGRKLTIKTAAVKILVLFFDSTGARTVEYYYYF